MKKKYKQVTDTTGNFLSSLIFPLLYVVIGLFIDERTETFLMSEIGSLTIVLMVIIGHMSRQQDDIRKHLQERYEQEQDLEELNKIKGDE